jgi:putative phosphoesterase
MFRSVAVLSDIHGVLPVLDAVLGEPLVETADVIVVTGDHAAGPMPVEVLDRLAGLGNRAVLVRGNADRDLVSMAREGRLPVGSPGATEWAAGQLRPDQIGLLDALPHPVTLGIEGFGDVLFCHGTPRDDNEVVLVDTRMDRWAEVLAYVPETVRTVVCGHTHMPFVRLVNRRLVVNPGSVGMPYGTGGPSWALLERGAVSLHRTAVDATVMAARVRSASSFPRVGEWVEEYLLTAAGDAEALLAFGPRDGRDPAGGIPDPPE